MSNYNWIRKGYMSTTRMQEFDTDVRTAPANETSFTDYDRWSRLLRLPDATASTVNPSQGCLSPGTSHNLIPATKAETTEVINDILSGTYAWHDEAQAHSNVNQEVFAEFLNEQPQLHFEPRSSHIQSRFHMHDDWTHENHHTPPQASNFYHSDHSRPIMSEQKGTMITNVDCGMEAKPEHIPQLETIPWHHGHSSYDDPSTVLPNLQYQPRNQFQFPLPPYNTVDSYSAPWTSEMEPLPPNLLIPQIHPFPPEQSLQRRLGMQRRSIGPLKQRCLRRTSETDYQLVQWRQEGLSYREIKRRGGYTEAESTLRGRFRSLTKLRSERLRKPVWTSHEIEALKEAVIFHTNPCWLRSTKPNVNILNKIPWKKVAEWMETERACYRFGNATVKKKYQDLLLHGHSHQNNNFRTAMPAHTSLESIGVIPSVEGVEYRY